VNKGARSRVYKNNEYNQLQGLCTGSSDPELWFSDTADQINGKGKRLEPEVKARMVARTLAAISICSICPIKEACLAEGMKPQNIDFGVWGGTLPGERLAMTTRSKSSRDVANKMIFARQVREAERLLLGEALS
jgi:hypothetical protein